MSAHPLSQTVAGRGELHGWVGWDDLFAGERLPCILSWPAAYDPGGLYPAPRFAYVDAVSIVDEYRRGGEDAPSDLVYSWHNRAAPRLPALVEIDLQTELASWVGPDVDELYSIGSGLLWQAYAPCSFCGDLPVELEPGDRAAIRACTACVDRITDGYSVTASPAGVTYTGLCRLPLELRERSGLVRFGAYMGREGSDEGGS